MYITALIDDFDVGSDALLVLTRMATDQFILDISCKDNCFKRIFEYLCIYYQPAEWQHMAILYVIFLGIQVANLSHQNGVIILTCGSKYCCCS